MSNPRKSKELQDIIKRLQIDDEGYNLAIWLHSEFKFYAFYKQHYDKQRRDNKDN